MIKKISRIIALLLAIIIVKFHIFSNNFNYSLLIISIIYILFSFIPNIDKFTNNLSYNKIKLSNIIFFILYFISILLLYYHNHRSIIFLFLIIILFLIISLQIMNNYKKLFILLELSFFLFLIIYSQYYVSFTIIGIDPWDHKLLIDSILKISFIEDVHSYSYMPIFHLLLVNSSLLSNINCNAITVLMSTLLASINILIIYSILNKFFIKKVVLLSLLVISITNWYIYFYINFIPNSLAYTFLIISFLLLTKKSKISLVYPLIMIFTHHLTIFYYILIISSIIVIRLFYKKDNRYYVNILFITSISLVIYWIYFYDFFGSFINIIFWIMEISKAEINTDIPRIILNYSKNIPFSDFFINNAGIFFYFMLAGLGIIYIRKNCNRFIYNISLITLLAIFIPIIAYFTAYIHIYQRFLFFSLIFITIFISYFLIIIYNYNKIFFYAFIFFISFFMIFSTPGNNDYHYFTPYYGVNYSLTEQDIVAINYLQYSNINVIYTDNYYNIVLKYYKKSKALAYESNNFDMYIATGDFPSSYKYILLRNYINNNTFKVFFSIYHLDYNINDSLYYYNLIYSSNNNSIYLR